MQRGQEGGAPANAAALAWSMPAALPRMPQKAGERAIQRAGAQAVDLLAAARQRGAGQS